MGLNKAMLIGNLGRDAELRSTGSGKSVCNFTIATNEHFTDAKGDKQERVEWHRVVCWSKLAENVAEYTGKGSKVYVEGRLMTREWEDKEGIKRYTTEIVAQQVQFLDNKGKGKSTDQAGDPGASDVDDPKGPPPEGDDTPF
jgi:single-strand DNA-binding protein